MRAGRLQHVVTLLKPTTTNGIRDFADWMTVRAMIEPQMGSEVAQGMEPPSTLTLRITIRHPRVDVTSAMRVRWTDGGTGTSHTYELVGPPVDEKMAHRDLVLTCREVVT